MKNETKVKIIWIHEIPTIPVIVILPCGEETTQPMRIDDLRDIIKVMQGEQKKREKRRQNSGNNI